MPSARACQARHRRSAAAPLVPRTVPVLAPTGSCRLLPKGNGNDLELHLVQLPRLSELSEVDRLADAALLPWTKFFAARSAEELDEAAMTDPAVSKARDILHRLSAEPDARRMAAERERAQITKIIEDGALREEGRREGHLQGLQEGHLQGLQEGHLQGLQEGHLQGLRESIVDLCEIVGIVLNAERSAQLEVSGAETLVALKEHVKLHRAWP